MPQPLVHIVNPKVHPDEKTRPAPGIVSARHYDSHLREKGWVVVDPSTGEPTGFASPDELRELKGAKLEQALAAAELTVTGTADEKRDALVAHYFPNPAGELEPQP